MKQATFGNFQVGMLDNPSVEDKGGFEFGAGMDIFSEPGVLKACNAMAPVTYGSGARPTDVPRFMVDTTDAATVRAYITAGSKILESTNGTTWNLFLTNDVGANLGLGIWAGYVVYPSASAIGRTPIGDASTKDDDYITTLDADSDHHPVVPQGGTLKIGAGRYVASLDEGFVFSARALKLPSDFRVRCLAEHYGKLFVGTRTGSMGDAVTNFDSSVFDWKGTVLSSGSALPDTPYPMKLCGMNALLSDGRNLYAFPDQNGDVLTFDGVGFVPLKSLSRLFSGKLTIGKGGVCQHSDNSILCSGNGNAAPGVCQMKDGAVCQAFVPSTATPGEAAGFNIGFVKTSFNGLVIIGYYKELGSVYHIEYSTSNKQNGAIVRTAWHRINTDKLKRWGGVKLNLKPLATGTAVDVSYRTQRDAAFTATGITITSANQDKPLLFQVQPRSRELQLQFKFTTSGANSPELLTYDLLYEILSSSR